MRLLSNSVAAHPYQNQTWVHPPGGSYVRGHELSAITGTNQSTVRIRKLNFAKYYKSTQERGDFHSEQ